MTTNTEEDPIFALIAAHKALEREVSRAINVRDEATFAANETHGKRPSPWVSWREYSMVLGEDELDRLRNKFLNEAGDSPEQIEKEYNDAKATLAANIRAEREWYQRTGVELLREHCECAEADEWEAGLEMAMTEPTTLAGAAAMIDYAWPEVANGATDEDAWPLVAIKTVSAALTRMNEGETRR
jgi:hypothetical protein